MIPAGYQLSLQSWEGDGDNYATQIFNGLTKEDVLFYLDIISNFSGKSSRYGHLGGDEIELSVLVQMAKDAVANHPGISSNLREQWTVDPEMDENEAGDRLMDYLCEILDRPHEEGYDYQYVRSVDDYSIKVHYFPEPVEDVTEQFKGAIK